MIQLHPTSGTTSHDSDDHDHSNTNNKKKNQVVSLSTAGVRALIYQLQSLYLRTPMKLFRPSRFDYLAFVRELANKQYNLDSKPYRLRTHSSIGMLINVTMKEGWKFIPDRVLPPLVANSATGIILYGSYLTSLDYFNGKKPSESARKEVSYSPIDTWRAGFVAGAVQSLAAAPIDAIYTRLSAAEVLEGNHQNLWVYGLKKLKEVGFVGVFAGYGVSFVKESFGFAFYFSTFETVKTQGYKLAYSIIQSYRNMSSSFKNTMSKFTHKPVPTLDPELIRLEQTRLSRVLKSSFILLAGASAAFSVLAVQYPIAKVQKIHLARLEALDIYNASNRISKPFVKLYYNSYIDTYNQILKMKIKSKQTWFELSYKGFFKNAVTTIPATSIGLLVFEIMRNKFADTLDDNGILEA